MEKLPPEILSLILPSYPGDIAIFRSVCRKWRELASEDLMRMEIPRGQSVRSEFVALFRACRDIRGFIFLSGGSVPDIPNPSLYITSLETLMSGSMCERLLSIVQAPGRCTLVVRVPFGCFYFSYCAGSLSIESYIGSTGFPVEDFHAMIQLFGRVLENVPVDEIFIDFGSLRDGRPSRKQAYHNNFLPFLARKKPHVLRFKGPSFDRVWGEVIPHIDWPFSLVRLQAYPPSLGIREPIEVPLIREGCILGSMEPPSFFFWKIFDGIQRTPLLRELLSPFPLASLESVKERFPSLSTFYCYTKGREYPPPHSTDISIVTFPYGKREPKEWKREKRIRKGLSPISSRSRGRNITPKVGPLDTFIQNKRRARFAAIQTLRQRIEESVLSSEWKDSLVLPASDEEFDIAIESPDIVPGFGLSPMIHIRDVRGPLYDILIPGKELSYVSVRWWRTIEKEIHIRMN